MTVENYAVKLLNREGRHFAVARAFYLVSAGKVRSIEAWLIRPDGSVKTYEKNAILDIIADPDDVYNEGRLKLIDASDDVDTGHIFGYTVVSEDVPLFYQDRWQFQSRLPTLVSRYSLNLPQGWKASSITFNAAEVKPAVSGSSYTWEMRNLPPIPPEPLSPAVENLAPRVAINYAPENQAQSVNRAFADWLDVSKWATAIYDPQVVIDDNIAAKARELTANAKTEFEKIQAIGSYVQNLQYISIDIGVAHGNGYKPRTSTLVLSRGYGDCKDKANLMRALLKALKIDAYPVAIYSGDPTFVRKEWASPTQFNHAIIAVKVSDATVAPTVMNHEKLGRLLIFDATDEYTPVGDLPDHLQGSYGLIAAGENGGLAPMPVTPPESDLLERDITVNLSDAGAISGKISERAIGRIGIRIDPGSGAGYTEHLEYSGTRPTKFGIDLDRFDAALAVAARHDLSIDTIHFHAGSGWLADGLSAFERALPAAVEAVQRARRAGHDIAEVNVGGGLGKPGRGDEVAVDLEAYAQVVARHLGPLGVTVAAEPGDHLSKDAGILLAEVVTVETRRGVTFVGLDMGWNVNCAYFIYGFKQEIVPCRDPAAPATTRVTVAGHINEASDVFAEDYPMAPVAEGDIVALLNAGGYDQAMSSTHCLRPMGSAVFLDRPSA